MAEAANTIQARPLDRALVLELLDQRLVEAEQVQQLGVDMKKAIANCPLANVVVDFERTEFLSSAALGVLVEVHAVVQAKGGEMRIANLSGDLRKIFKLTRFDKLMKIHKTNEDAMKSFK